MCASLSNSVCSCPRLPVDTGQVSAPQSFCKMKMNVVQLEGKESGEITTEADGVGGGDGREGGAMWGLGVGQSVFTAMKK